MSGAILEQSSWIGLGGALLTMILAGLAVLVARSFHVPLDLDGGAVSASAALRVAAAVFSGLLALRESRRLVAAELLR